MIGQFGSRIRDRERVEMHVYVYNVIREKYSEFYKNEFGQNVTPQNDDAACYIRAIGFHFYEGNLRANHVLPILEDIHKYMIDDPYVYGGWTEDRRKLVQYWYDRVLQDVTDSLRIR